ncbi:3-hydroxyacyl-CoA dehydrogenase family protein [Halorubrum sp. DTA98]|uniref:3-hydroxyacyl-CoA dehydrogenase family protein n=1 Tax=Halorubrum sp. DTA98 TaxID=3402163 RepID=UPI003AAAC3B4
MTRPTIAIVGGGNMGHGLAAHFHVHGGDVTLIDHRESNLTAARTRIRETFSFLADEEIADVEPDRVDGIDFTTDLSAGVGEADVVIETVPEDVDTKHEVFTEIAASAPADAVLASNTSSIPITTLAEPVPDAADRVVGCHWWYPPYLLTPVEVVRGEETSEATVETLTALLEAVDRDPILVDRDVPGFVWNRVQRAVFRECFHMVEEGIASIDDVNRAIRDGYAARTAVIGPFETIDIAGIEQILPGTKRIQPTLCNDDDPSPLYEEYLDRGRGGIEDGAGFFEYERSAAEITSDRDRKIAALRRSLLDADDEDSGR